jgi:hypothetical protein
MHRSAVVVAVALAIVAGGKAVAADPALVEAARKEGKVVWYTTLIVKRAWPAASRPTCSTASPT